MTPTYWWIACVPSFSNPSDAPSRGKGAEEARNLNAVFRGPFDHDSRLEKITMDPEWQELMW